MEMEHHLPDEEVVFKFYDFKFAGIEKPVTIGAVNNNIARELLKDALLKMGPEYGLSKVISETVTTPIEGVSKLIIDGIQHIWAGFVNSATGWMPADQYTELINSEKKK